MMADRIFVTVGVPEVRRSRSGRALSLCAPAFLCVRIEPEGQLTRERMSRIRSPVPMV